VHPTRLSNKHSVSLKVRLAENGWNSRDSVALSMTYTPESVWRNRSEFINGKEAIIRFLENK